MGRLTHTELVASVGQLDVLNSQMSFIEATEHLVRAAGSLAELHRLRGCDAVHLAAVQAMNDGDAVLVSGDRRLIDAAAREGVATTLVGESS